MCAPFQLGGCGPSVWLSTCASVVEGMWRGLSGRESQRRVHVHVKSVDVINAAKAYPDGLLAVLTDWDVDSKVFGTEAVRAVVVGRTCVTRPGVRKWLMPVAQLHGACLVSHEGINPFGRTSSGGLSPVGCSRWSSLSTWSRSC
jgi:hypothetical protein